MKIGFLLLFITSLASAEYRVYKLALIDKEGNKVKDVLSTLDHLQYPEYFDTPQNYQVRYLDSWKCFEHTGNFKAFCQNPHDSAGRLPSSTLNE